MNIIARKAHHSHTRRSDVISRSTTYEIPYDEPRFVGHPFLSKHYPGEQLPSFRTTIVASTIGAALLMSAIFMAQGSAEEPTVNHEPHAVCTDKENRIMPATTIVDGVSRPHIITLQSGEGINQLMTAAGINKADYGVSRSAELTDTQVVDDVLSAYATFNAPAFSGDMPEEDVRRRLTEYGQPLFAPDCRIK